MFTHLHVHSYYSLMDGLNSPEELCNAAADLGQTSIAVTDHGTLSAHREWQDAAKKAGLKPILGVEAYISETDRFDKRGKAKRDDGTNTYNHVVLLAKSQQGLVNLNKLSERAWTEGFYYKPRIDFELLDELGDDIIVLSGCLNGLLCKAIEKDDPESAKKWLTKFKERFEDDFFIEVQAHNPRAMNAQLLAYADAYNIKPVITADCHFARESERAIEEAMLVLSTSPKAAKGQDYQSTKHITDMFERLDALYPDRSMSFKGLDLFVNSRADLYGLMQREGFNREDIYENTQVVASRIGNYDYYEDLDLLPTPRLSIAKTPGAELRGLVERGLQELGLADSAQYQQRAREELEVIEDKNFSNYFLIVADMVAWAKSQGILIGPGRGSAAGSLVCYALGITQVDPIEYDLLFFRFLNPDRNDWPDIDIDFQMSRRGEVKEYMRKKYGNVASISTYTYFKDKNVIKDAARVLRVPLPEVERATKQIDSFEDFETSSETLQFRNDYPEVLQLARALKGRIRSAGMHPAGLVVSKEPIERHAPIETRPDPKDKVAGRIPTVALDMDVVAAIGLIKFDFLGLTALDFVHDALVAIKERHGVDVQLPTHKSELNDPRVFEALGKGDTVGVFQVDQAAYTGLLQEMKIENFEDLVASNALVRPGARNTVGKAFIDRQYGREQVRYVHERMEPFLKNTYGVVVYQEQVMQAATELGGLSMVDADKMRKVIGKKKDVREFEQFREAFVEGASRFIHKAEAKALFHDFEAHAGYSFNRSHAVAYSMLVYWTAWLKLYYPLEYMYSLLKNEDDKDKPTDYLIEAKRKGCRMILPHVNKSEAHFSLEDDAIRFGLTSVKYISDKVAANIITARPFKSYTHLLEVAGAKGSGINTRTVGALNKIGAAAFKDNPRRGDESDYYYEYLKIPKFDTHDFPKDMLTGLENYNEDDCFLLQAMVKKVKRSGKGWAKVDVVDATGTGSIFAEESISIEAGQQYVLLVAGNSVTDYIEVDKLWEQRDEPEHPIAKFMWLDAAQLGITPGWKYVLKFAQRRTKAGKLMANMVLSDEHKEMRRVLVFPREFKSTYGRIKEGECLSVKVKRLPDGALHLVSIED